MDLVRTMRGKLQVEMLSIYCTHRDTKAYLTHWANIEIGVPEYWCHSHSSIPDHSRLRMVQATYSNISHKMFCGLWGGVSP